MDMFDKTNDISEKYAIHYLPTKYLIDKQGNIVCKIDESNEGKLEGLISDLLK
jgi:glutathione peroxidase-family protein